MLPALLGKSFPLLLATPIKLILSGILKNLLVKYPRLYSKTKINITK